MSYVTENNEVYRNLQEQVLKNANDIEALKTGIVIFASCPTIGSASPFITEENLGKYILIGTTTPKNLYVVTLDSLQELSLELVGPFPAGIKGDTGATGATGPQGTRGPALWSVGSTKPSPSSYIQGDLILLTGGECKGQLYKNVNNAWVLVSSVRGPEGPIGPAGTSITPNPTVPEGETTQQLTILKIDGVYYSTTHLTAEEQAMMTNLLANVEFDEDGSVTFGHDIYADGGIESGTDVTVGRNLYVDDASKIQDPDGNKIFENLSDNLIPIIDQELSLGTPEKKWYNMYLSNKLFFGNTNWNIGYTGGTNPYLSFFANNQEFVRFSTSTIYINKILSTAHVVPQENNLSDLGSNSKKWKDIYAQGKIYLFSSTGETSINGGNGYQLVIKVNNVEYSFSNTKFVPPSNNFYKLGDEGYRWKTIYGIDINVSNQIQIGNTTLTEAQLIALLALIG